MKRVIRLSIFAILALGVAIPTMEAGKKDDDAGPKKKEQVVVYRPPLRGAPAAGSRLGAASRGWKGDKLVFAALEPGHTGWTGQADPTLYWYQSASAKAPVVLTVAVEGQPRPLMELSLKDTSPGIHGLSLAGQGVHLSPGQEVQWSASVVRDPENRSLDIVSTGFLRREVPPAGLASQLAGADPQQQVRLYAEHGYWYDAFDTASRALQGHPDDATLREMRAELLDQVGLPEPAGWVRHGAP